MSCVSFSGKPARDWPEPSKPLKYKVDFVVVNNPTNGLFLDTRNAKNLAINIAEMEGYIAKMEALTKEMQLYYGEK